VVTDPPWGWRHRKGPRDSDPREGFLTLGDFTRVAVKSKAVYDLTVGLSG